jgi:Flp pilus assembly protein TadD
VVFDGGEATQLVLARLVDFAGDEERACLIYDRAATSQSHCYAALLGKASLLVEQRTESALAIFEDLCAQAPTDPDPCEGRARALEKLGRLGEAAAEFRRFISLATSRSDIRVRAAADWLRDHPL